MRWSAAVPTAASWASVGVVGVVGFDACVGSVVSGVVAATVLDGASVDVGAGASVVPGEASSSPEQATSTSVRATATATRPPVMAATRGEATTSRPFTMPRLGSVVRSGADR